MLPKVIYRFNANCIKILMVFFVEIEKQSQNSYGTTMDLNSQNSLEKNKAVGFTFSDFKIYYITTPIKIAWFQHNDRYINRWNRIKDPGKKKPINGQMIFDKGTKNTQRGKESLFNK